MTKHWSDNCLGHYQYLNSTYKFFPWKGRKELKPGNAVYSPIIQDSQCKCEKCNHVFGEIMSLQRHTVVRTKKGRRQGKLLWKHDGYIVPKIKDPTVEKMKTAGPKYLYDNNLSFIIRHWGRNPPNTATDTAEINCKDITFQQACSLSFNSFSIYHPTQWDEVPARENSVTKALENL
jgi:hypothetical protein